jgi:2-polyprenyl-3-methyl-5-hydroxy-6-metoxy-1,4-benzoquinol methylase
VTDPELDAARLQEQVRELATQIAEQLGPEPMSQITTHLARLAARDESDALPAVEQAHAALQQAPGAPAGAVGRGRGDLIAAVQQLSDEVAAHRTALDAVLAALADSLRAGTHRHPELEGELDALHDRFAHAERQRAWTPTDLDLTQRLDALERAQRATEFNPWYSSQRFTEAFRGAPEAIDARYDDLADRIAAAGGPVLDLGCGSGELLRLLAKRGVAARGIDSDVESVNLARAHGLVVDHGDALEELTSVAAGSLGALVLIQVVEHLGAPQLVEAIALAADKLRPGGLLVAETLNPGSFYVYSHALYLDPTHSTPIHPLYLSFLCQEAGFAAVEVQYRSHPPADEQLPPVDGGDATLVDGVNRTIARLNELLFGPQDYAVLATR